MKKKGLIISTVVMVVVLIASLTTATYAWFTQDSKTTISGFELQVVAGNAVNIGLKADLTKEYSAADTSTAFVTGTCTYTGTKGSVTGVGTWEGDPGLSPTLDHQILFGDMSKAVGFTAGAIADATTATAGYFNAGQNALVANKGKADGTLQGITEAVVNGNIATGTKGDLAYLWLGVSPAQTLKAGAKLHVYIQSIGGGDNLGIAAAVHVAYNVNNTGWKDVDAFNNVTPENTTNTINYATTKAAYTTTMKVDASDTFTGAIKGSVQTGMADVVIDLTKVKVGDLDQVQLVIYLAGKDDDCIDAAKGVNARIGMYFEAEEVEGAKSNAPTEAKVDSTGKLTLTGVRGSSIEYKVADGAWTKIEGKWDGTSFTANAALPADAKGKTIKVRQIEDGKATSDEATVNAAAWA